MEKKVTNILFILPEFEPDTSGGICAYYKNLLTEFQLNDHNFNFTIIQGNAFETRGGTLIWNGINVFFLDEQFFKQKSISFNHLNIFPELQNHLAAAWAMYDLAYTLNIDFDLVITTDWGLGFVPWIIQQKIPVNVHLHGSIGQIDFYEPRSGLTLFSSLYLQIESDLFNYANQIITHSNENIKFWKQRLVNNDLFKLIPPCLNNVVTKHSFSFNTTYVGLVLARIQYWKGPIDLCEAIQLLSLENQQKLKIYWAGRDTIFSQKEISMNSYLLTTYPNIWGKIIIPIGNKTKTEIQDLYQEIDFTIVPSNWDMFNMSAIEHLLNNKPLICSDKAGVSEFICNLKSVTIVHDIGGLAEVLTGILNKPKEKLQKIAEEDTETVKKLFDKKLILPAHEKTFNDNRPNYVKSLNLTNKFSWLIPITSTQMDSREKILSFWPLKKTIVLLFKILKNKLNI